MTLLHASGLSHTQLPNYLSKVEMGNSHPKEVVDDAPDPCTDYLSDKEYLVHMIPHHQVAIDMSRQVMQHTSNPYIKEIANRIIWQQTFENSVMGWQAHTASDGRDATEIVRDRFDLTSMDFYEPEDSAPAPGYVCDPMFFDPESHHKKHASHGSLTDKMFLEHMIPHHQVAVDMSRRLLAHSDNPMLRGTANKIIRDQQLEMYTMNQMLDDPERLSMGYPSI